MATERKKINRSGNRRIERIIAVDVWRPTFGEHSVNAIYKLHAELFKIKREDMRKYSFTHCVDAIRLLEDPNYIPPNKR